LPNVNAYDSTTEIIANVSGTQNIQSNKSI
jgi:hypothetical protein